MKKKNKKKTDQHHKMTIPKLLVCYFAEYKWLHVYK
jgi:hypothetical protein